jgi:hypothetical protein
VVHFGQSLPLVPDDPAIWTFFRKKANSKFSFSKKMLKMQHRLELKGENPKSDDFSRYRCDKKLSNLLSQCRSLLISEQRQQPVPSEVLEVSNFWALHVIENPDRNFGRLSALNKINTVSQWSHFQAVPGVRISKSGILEVSNSWALYVIENPDESLGGGLTFHFV